MRAPGRTSTVPEHERRRECSLCRTVRHGTLPTARSARSVSAFYSIAYVTQRTNEEERRETGQECPSSPRDSLSYLPLLPRIVTIRPCGNVRSTSPLREHSSAHRFQCAFRTIFSLYTITPQFAANVHQTFKRRARATRHRSLNGNSGDLFARSRCSSRLIERLEMARNCVSRRLEKLPHE